MDDQSIALRTLSRRAVLKAGAVAGVGTMASTFLIACGSTSSSIAPSAAAPSAAAPSAAAPSSAASTGQLAAAQLEIWYQDWPPATEFFKGAKQAVESEQPNIKITLTPLPYEQLQQKLLPSIAAGNEPEVMMAYSSWLVASKIETLFTPLVPNVMSKADADTYIYPSALAEGGRGDKYYYLAWANGMGGSTFTYNVDLLQAAGVDPTAIKTWDDLVAAGKKLVQWDGTKLVRAGVGFSPYIASAWVSGMAQLGQAYFDATTGKFNLTSDIAKQALKNVDDLLKVHKLDDITKEAPSHANMTGYSAPDGFEKGLAAITNFGSWIVSGYEKTTPNFKAGIFPMPSMGTATQNIELSHNGIIVLSRRLANDPAKLAAATLLAQKVLSPQGLGNLTDFYGGAIPAIPVARSQDVITKRRWGYLQKQYDQLVWPIATFEQHHIADWNLDIAWPQLLRVFKDSEPMDAVLKDLESQSNQQEQEARDRLGV
jgi:ABC-type glycerol-3-phosphate transport system substrate-binding protein